MEVIQMLYKEKVISKEILQETKKCRGSLSYRSMRALSNTVANDPNKLSMLAAILLRSQDTQHISKDILKGIKINTI